MNIRQGRRLTAAFTLASAAFFAAASPAKADSFESWATKGRVAVENGNLSMAMGDFTKALAAWGPESGKKAKAEVLCARSDLYRQLMNPNAALGDINDAIALDDARPSYYYRQGELRLQLSQAAKAVASFYKAVSLNFNYKEAYYGRAQAYAAQGNALFAHQDYVTACNLGFSEACAVLSPQSRPQRQERKRFPACLERLRRCAAGGQSYGDCVRAAKSCEKHPVRGCCPRACLKAFDAAVQNESEAQAWREIFIPKNSCAAGWR